MGVALPTELLLFEASLQEGLVWEHYIVSKRATLYQMKACSLRLELSADKDGSKSSHFHIHHIYYFCAALNESKGRISEGEDPH